MNRKLAFDFLFIYMILLQFSKFYFCNVWFHGLCKINWGAIVFSLVIAHSSCWDLIVSQILCVQKVSVHTAWVHSCIIWIGVTLEWSDSQFYCYVLLLLKQIILIHDFETIWWKPSRCSWRCYFLWCILYLFFSSFLI